MDEKVTNFAEMNPDQRRAMAQKGGRAAWDKGVAHRFTREEASRAGRIGGLRSVAAKRARKAAAK